ncbi:hypothetical protein [Rhizobium laguerreae]|uniref:hypothetical protein n=1 Tax=Rhizobium laguerreae TaxID=1076926 RepID=UPI001C909B54|nr:hypothetical protein [Rhizobium laguerreae]MBY3489430.1 hypothetical protein [Rhizobium laguerreae]
MSYKNLSHLSDENRNLLNLRKDFEKKYQLEPEAFWPFWPPCRVKILIVVDGLDFSDANFGLATFVRSLLDIPGNYVRFAITLAHINAVSSSEMMDGEIRIANRITEFKFDNVAHFGIDMYDEVFLLGIATSFFGRGTATNGQPYPSDRLADPELLILTQFMNNGGGLFATGDHGMLGRPLCHAIPRARNMRLWQSTAAQNADDQVSMTGERRNDTNRRGHDVTSEFNDQSDDVPQPIQPKIYQRRNGLFRFKFPHPVLCGPKGVIRIMPDHPHEGECIEPPDPDQTLNIGGPLGPEYPAAIDAGTRPLPEIISISTVLSGTTSSGKNPTISQSFGGISAYDGHRAGIGRVVTDATWHHFVNINLVGEIGTPGPKGLGFLDTPAGQGHFEEIKAYYRNLAVWLARPQRIKCMNARLSWTLVWSDRVMEAVLTTADIKVAEVDVYIFRIIGQHARDVLGRFAGQCQSIRLVLDLVLQPTIPELIPEIDPWIPEPQALRKRFDGIDWFDASPLLDIAFGAGLVALREAFPIPDASLRDLETERVVDIMSDGARIGLEQGFRSMASAGRLVQRHMRYGNSAK